MQKTYLLILLALTLSCALCDDYVEKNFAKMPVSIKNETNFRTGFYSGYLNFGSHANGDLSVTKIGFVKNYETGFTYWNFWERTLNPETLEITSTKNYSLPGGPNMTYYSGYAIEITLLPTYYYLVTQTRLEDNVTLPSFELADRDARFIGNFTDGEYFYVASSQPSYRTEGNLTVSMFKLGASSVEKKIHIPLQNSYEAKFIKGGIVSGSKLLMLVDGTEVLMDFSDGSYKMKENSRSDVSLYVTNETFGSIRVYLGNNFNFDVYLSSNLSGLQYKYTIMNNNYFEGVFAHGNNLAVLSRNDAAVSFFKPYLSSEMYYYYNPLTNKNSTEAATTYMVGKKDFQKTITYQAPNQNVYMLLYTTDSEFDEDVSELRVGILIRNPNSKAIESNEDATVIQEFLA